MGVLCLGNKQHCVGIPVLGSHKHTDPLQIYPRSCAKATTELSRNTQSSFLQAQQTEKSQPVAELNV